ncbi:HNH endonuclease [Psychromonas ossibalaenae]|uniref:HNH endonuclease n=1 Tax=Psychromonas ossibalaenae TaxID=444922 RepID=UPI0003600E3E|nr:HNH endonuclease [Psychromonas ossibalaenae]
MFFPKLIRRSEEDYFNIRKKFYANYRDNYPKVKDDCKSRCVYCDITVKEYGGDNMQLDHFRPQEHFEHLETHPHNLYLSCPKCNVLKTSDWPCCKKTNDAPSFVGSIGYLDRFKHNADDYLRVEKDGTITHIAGPTNYMIMKMKLNRPSRTNIRRKRIIESQKTKLLIGINKLTEKLLQDSKSGKISMAQVPDRLENIRLLTTMAQSI